MTAQAFNPALPEGESLQLGLSYEGELPSTQPQEQRLQSPRQRQKLLHDDGQVAHGDTASQDVGVLRHQLTTETIVLSQDSLTSIR